VRHLYEVLGHELSRSHRLKLPLSLAFLDLDRFKTVNMYMAPCGQRTAGLHGKRLQNWRQTGPVLPLRGDEFAILMPETGEAALPSQELLGALMETTFKMKNGLGLTVRASVGLATAPEDGATVHGLSVPDSRMYMVKNSGRGRFGGVEQWLVISG